LSAEQAVTDVEPIRTEGCPPFSGVANPFVTKFQATKCQHCTQIYKYAKDKEEETGVE